MQSSDNGEVITLQVLFCIKINGLEVVSFSHNFRYNTAMMSVMTVRNVHEILLVFLSGKPY